MAGIFGVKVKALIRNSVFVESVRPLLAGCRHSRVRLVLQYSEKDGNEGSLTSIGDKD